MNYLFNAIRIISNIYNLKFKYLLLSHFMFPVRYLDQVILCHQNKVLISQYTYFL